MSASARVPGLVVEARMSSLTPSHIGVSHGPDKGVNGDSVLDQAAGGLPG